MFMTGVKLTITARSMYRRIGRFSIVGNHRSYFDVVMTYARCPRLTGYVAKVEMLRYPLLRDWMKNLYCLFLDRDDIKAGLKTILKGIEYIKNGISICIFPEGTRNHHDELLPFKEGSMKMAKRQAVPSFPGHHQFRGDL